MSEITTNGANCVSVNMQDNAVIDSIIAAGKFTMDMANDISYETEILPNFRNTPVRVFRTNNYLIYRPLEKNNRTPNMYCFSEIENFFLKQPGDDPQVCYFGSNNFDDFDDKILPVKIYRRK